MQLLKSYLSPRMRSTIAYLRNPKRYPEALQALRQRYEDHDMIDRAHVAELVLSQKELTELNAVLEKELQDDVGRNQRVDPGDRRQ